MWDVPVVCWAPSDGGFIRFDTSRYAASTQIIEALTEGKPVALPEAQQPIVISRGTEEIQGSDMDGEADPLENPDRYETPQTAAAMPMPEDQPAPAPETQPHPVPAVDETPPEPWTDRELKAWNNLQVAREDLPSEYADALTECGLIESEVNPGNAGEVLHALNRILDGGEA